MEDLPENVERYLPWAREMLADPSTRSAHVFALGYMSCVVEDLLRGRVEAPGVLDTAARAYALYLVANRQDTAAGPVDPHFEVPADVEGHAPTGRSVVAQAAAEVPAELAPKFPRGTPEYAAYKAELKTELAKFAKAEAPYGYGPAAVQDPTAQLITEPTQSEYERRHCGSPLSHNPHQWYDLDVDNLRVCSGTPRGGAL